MQTVRADLAFITVEHTKRGVAGLPGLGGRRIVKLAMGLSFGLGILALGSLFWTETTGGAAADPPPPLVQPVAVSKAPSWISIVRPFATFDLTGSSYAKLPLLYRARRDGNGSARQDIMTYGSPKPESPFLRMMFYRKGGEAVPDTTLFVDAARLAGDVGLAVVRSGLASSLSTRFGTFEVAGVAISQAARSANCLAFRRAGSASLGVLQITGLACGGENRTVDPVTLACTLDRIDLVSAGDDTDLQDIFVAAERRRGKQCGEGRSAGLSLLPSPSLRKANALKGSLQPTVD